MKKNNSKADLRAKLLEILDKDRVPCAVAKFFACQLLYRIYVNVEISSSIKLKS